MNKLSQKELIGALIVEASTVLFQSGDTEEIEKFYHQYPGFGDDVLHAIGYAKPVDNGGTFKPTTCLEVILAALETLKELEKEEGKGESDESAGS